MSNAKNQFSDSAARMFGPGSCSIFNICNAFRIEEKILNNKGIMSVLLASIHSSFLVPCSLFNFLHNLGTLIMVSLGVALWTSKCRSLEVDCLFEGK
jgi:hypothetical protein